MAGPGYSVREFVTSVDSCFVEGTTYEVIKPMTGKFLVVREIFIVMTNFIDGGGNAGIISYGTNSPDWNNVGGDVIDRGDARDFEIDEIWPMSVDVGTGPLLSKRVSLTSGFRVIVAVRSTRTAELFDIFVRGVIR